MLNESLPPTSRMQTSARYSPDGTSARAIPSLSHRLRSVLSSGSALMPAQPACCRNLQRLMTLLRFMALAQHVEIRRGHDQINRQTQSLAMPLPDKRIEAQHH